jgi:hypothetical protein
MNPADPPSPSDKLAAFLERGQGAQRAVDFEIAASELRRLGIDLSRMPGEYRVNFHNGTESTAQIAETIEAALDLGRAMAAERAAAAPNSRGPRRRRRMTPKAYNKRLRLAHMRKLRARTRRQSAVPAKPTTDDT